MKRRTRFPVARALLAVLLALYLTIVALLPVAAQTNDQTGGPQSDVASYDIDVTLDEGAEQLRGSERIVYRNPSADTLNEVWMHLYLNAFSSPTTQWMKESGGEHRGFSADAPGWIKVESLTLAGSGEPLSLVPGDPDETTAHFALPRDLGPGEALSFDVRWTAQSAARLRAHRLLRGFCNGGTVVPRALRVRSRTLGYRALAREF